MSAHLSQVEDAEDDLLYRPHPTAGLHDRHPEGRQQRREALEPHAAQRRRGPEAEAGELRDNSGILQQPRDRVKSSTEMTEMERLRSRTAVRPAKNAAPLRSGPPVRTRPTRVAEEGGRTPSSPPVHARGLWLRPCASASPGQSGPSPPPAVLHSPAAYASLKDGASEPELAAEESGGAVSDPQFASAKRQRVGGEAAGGEEAVHPSGGSWLPPTSPAPPDGPRRASAGRRRRGRRGVAGEPAAPTAASQVRR